MSKIELVVWDWNGTILADTQACMDAGNHVITTFGGTPVPRRQYAATFDFPSIEFYCRQGCDRKALERPGAADVFHDFYEERARHCRTRRGARETLDWLRQHSIDSVILSNHIQEAILVQLKRLGLTDYFDEVLANIDRGAANVGKNKVQRLEDYLTRTRHNPLNAVIVGDSTEDVVIGKKLHMRTTALRDGYFSTPRLRASNPDYIIGNLAELVGIIKGYK